MSIEESIYHELHMTRIYAYLVCFFSFVHWTDKVYQSILCFIANDSDIEVLSDSNPRSLVGEEFEDASGSPKRGIQKFSKKVVREIQKRTVKKFKSSRYKRSF